MKVHIKKDRLSNIALMSIPAVMIAPVSIPIAVLIAIGSGSLLSTVSDETVEVDLDLGKLLQEMVKSMYAGHVIEEERKRLAHLYWNKQYRDK